jgi:hypothetical protein
MNSTKWIAIAVAAAVVVSCNFPWVHIPGRDMVIGGFQADINDYGKPGVLHAFFCGFYILFLLLHKMWSVRTAFFIGTFNIAWALRNFVLLTSCGGGECPEKLPALYVILVGSFLMTILVLLIPIRQKVK